METLFTAGWIIIGLSLVIGVLVASWRLTSGDVRGAGSALWGAWTIMICLFFLMYGCSSPDMVVDDDWPEDQQEVGGVDAGEAMMVSSFRQYADRISTAAARLEGLCSGGGSLSADETSLAQELGDEFWHADPEVLYVDPDAKHLDDVQALLSQACEHFRAACSELSWSSGDRGAARSDYREGAELLSQGEQILSALERVVPPE